MYKVMIVDDFEIMRRRLKRLSLWKDSQDFIIVAEAEDGQDALNQLRIEPVDLLITDIRMPGMDGLELLEYAYLEELTKFTVFLSDHEEFSLAKGAMKFRLFDYLVKPVEEKELEDLLAKIKLELIKEEEKIAQLDSEEYIMPEAQYLERIAENLTEAFCEGDLKEVHQYIKKLFKDTLLYHRGNYALAHMRVENLMIITMDNISKSTPWLKDYYLFPSLKVSDEDTKNRYKEKEEKVNEFMEQGVRVVNHLVLSHEDGLIEKACLYALNHVEKDLQLGYLAADLYVTQNHLGDVFKRETGITLGQYISRVKIERGKFLLKNSSLKTYEIALILGYKDAEYFSKVFKKIAGKTPKAFQEDSN